MAFNDRQRILLVEDDPVSLSIMQSMIKHRAYIIETASNGKEALEKFHQQPAMLVVTDIHMPLMDGRLLIEKLAQTQQDPVVIVVSGEEDLNIVLQIMRQGVYDYLTKPINTADFNYKIEKGLELARLRRESRAVRREREILHSQKLDWTSWKEAILRKNLEKIEINLFANIKTSFAQSAGFGGLVSLIPFIRMQAKEMDNGFLVPRELLEMLEKNATAAAKTFEKFDEISQTISREFTLESRHLSDLETSVQELAREMAPVANIKKITIMVADSVFRNMDFILQIEKAYLLSALHELLLNAIRFSKEGSSIVVLYEHKENNIHINIISDPTPARDGIIGIPKDFEKLVFEPFYRLHMTVDERFDALDFGIGLTLADKIVRKNNGRILLHNISDHSSLGGEEKKQKVEATIILPLVE